jgi:hypothetical protein
LVTAEGKVKIAPVAIASSPSSSQQWWVWYKHDTRWSYLGRRGFHSSNISILQAMMSWVEEGGVSGPRYFVSFAQARPTAEIHSFALEGIQGRNIVLNDGLRLV